MRLVGPPVNREAIGASLRVGYEEGDKGPRRSVQAGSGYWSQNSAVQVLGTERDPSEIEVTWPGGQRERVPLRVGQAEIVIRHPDARSGS